MNAFLILVGDRVILVDTGAGIFGAKCFKLPKSLKAAGYTPEQVTDFQSLIFTSITSAD